MATYSKPRQWKKEESERLRGEEDKIKFIDLGFERWQVVRFRNGRRRQHVPYVLGMDNCLWDGVRRLSSETWKGCE